MKIFNLSQDSPEWLEWRNTGIGASESGAILGLDPWKSREQLMRCKLGLEAGPYFNAHMRRGKLLEPEIRARYEGLFGYQMDPLCVAHDELPWLKCSLDGIRRDHKVILEIKAPGEKGQLKVWESGIPDHYYCQVQHQLLITKAKLCHFVSYNVEVDISHRFFVQPVRPDREFQIHLLEELQSFWAEYQSRTIS